MQTLLPRKPEVRLVNGEALYRYGGRNYPPSKDTGPAPECRIEVSPSAPAGVDYFLHVLTATEAKTAAVRPASVRVSGGKIRVTVGGARPGETSFNRDGQDRQDRSPASIGRRQHPVHPVYPCLSCRAGPRKDGAMFRASLWALVLLGAACSARAGVRVPKSHPRIFVTRKGLVDLARRSAGPLRDDYAAVKRAADAAVKRGRVNRIGNKWAIPADLMNCGLAYLVERARGRPHRRYADLVIKQWGDGKIIENKKGSHFGYHALAYDWIYDALSPAERRRYGDALGSWLRYYTDRPEIMLKWGHWEYNQTWGPIHLNIMNSRDALTQKLFIALAILGAGTRYEKDAAAFFRSWARRVPAECIPAFDTMGGVWAESAGHGSYGPVTVVPYAMEAWRTATGENLFTAGKPWSFLVEESRWMAYVTTPHTDRIAWIDDGGGQTGYAFARAAPMVARALGDPLAQWFTDRGKEKKWIRYEEPWQRVASYDPTLRARSPKQLRLPLAYLFKGAGHVYMRSGWGDPDATWAFFGVGPHLAGHAHDDEGHFLISRKGALVSKQGGRGHNDSDHYWGGSIVFNIVTIYDPREKFRRNRKNENDGGLIRHVYSGKAERGRIVAYRHDDRFTYAAGDVTKGYNAAKAKEVVRQFLYLRGRYVGLRPGRTNGRGREEYFVVFDRVESTRPEFAKHFMLHLPTEPALTGRAKVRVKGHVVDHEGEGIVATWLGLPEDSGVPALSRGRSRMFMKTLLPARTTVTKRGGEGHEAWGHPLEPTAQYNHSTKDRTKPPICPWRLEVAAPRKKRTYFLHVFQVADETARRMAPVKLTASGARIALKIGRPGREWTVTFARRGAVSASVRAPGSRNAVRLRPEIIVKSQYDHWQTILRPSTGSGRRSR